MCKVFSHTVAGLISALLFITSLFSPTTGFTQTGPKAEGDTVSRIVVASDRYQQNNFYQWLWGRHYREVWNTPVRVPVLDLETAGGGLTPVRRGGGWQTRTLHLKGKDGHDYVLRSIDKYYGQALPELYKGTFVETLISDQASTAHPYAAFTIPGMISAAKIYHTNPRLVIIPDHPILDSFRGTFGNMLALFEERADDDQSHAPHFGRSTNVVGTEKMLENITENHSHRVDQLAYVKARIFDMFIGDWGRHEDQWRWGQFKEKGLTIYRPIPRDRDQTYTLFDGVMLKMALGAAKLKHLQSFGHSIKNVKKYNYPARYLDRRLANEPTREQWIAMASEIQAAMTDDVIRAAVMQMPKEAYLKSGDDIIAKLISRRNSLKEFAETYYEFLAEEVEIVGSDIKDVFTINKMTPGEVNIKLSRPNKSGASDILFDRTFLASETEEVSIYGLKGDDEFHAVGSGNGITIRLIAGDGKDKIIAPGSGEQRNLIAYDKEDQPESSAGLRLKVTSDTLKTDYRYNRFVYNKKGLKFKPGTTVGIGYSIQKQKWGVQPYGYEHSLMFEWTFTRGGFALVYRGQFNEVIGKLGLAPIIRYDFPYVDHFFGIGNNTTRLNEDTRNSFYRVHTTELLAGLGINRRIDSHFVQLQPYYQTVEPDVQKDKFLDWFPLSIPGSDYRKKTFGGVELLYRYQKRNDPLTPTLGIGFTATANYIQNFTDDNRDITRYGGALWGYVPLFKNTTLALRVGGATLDGSAPVFYQLNTLGGNINLRGYARRRFFGTTAGYNNNEIRWLANTRNRLFNGQIGLLAFFDQGRIWQKGETSDKWHYGYGGGLVIVPFRRAVLNGTVGFGDERPIVHARIGFLF